MARTTAGHRFRRINRRGKRNRDTRGTRQKRAVTQEPPRARQRYRHNRRARGYGSAKRSELKWPHAFLRHERALGKNEHGIALAQALLDLMHLAQPRARVMAIEREVPHFVEKSSDERHRVHFTLGDKTIRHAQAHHQRQHVEVAGVI